jgi:hypothetical protein
LSTRRASIFLMTRAFSLLARTGRPVRCGKRVASRYERIGDHPKGIFEHIICPIKRHGPSADREIEAAAKS